MGFFTRASGNEKKQPYLDAGTVLIHKLTTTFSLPGWKDLLPIGYTAEEGAAIDKRLSEFQQQADEIAGGKAKFHPDFLPVLQRMLTAEALTELAEAWKWLPSDELPSDWKNYVSIYLKAWVTYFDPLSLKGLGTLLIKAGYRSEAKETFQVILFFPTYARTYYEESHGLREAGSGEEIVDYAKDSLRELA